MSEPAGDLKRTPLHALHQECGARFAPFAGYDMPVQFPSGILSEHLHTRKAAGLFDVSHMGQLRLSGASAGAVLESLMPIDIVGLAEGRQRYGLLTNGEGGILDDLMVTNAGDHFFVVVNAACKDADEAHLRAHLEGDCSLEALEDRALIALQGPAAAEVLGRLAPDAAALSFMTAAPLAVDGIACFVSRSGYTGEDGFEISLPASSAEALARRLLEDEAVAPIGLGARDSLRLEAGLCLYGSDIDTQTTPVEAGLTWALSKARRADGARPGGYPGDRVILGQLAKGAARKRVGLKPDGRAPVRGGTELVDETGDPVGKVTSGGYGPSVGGPVAMGYVKTDLAGEGQGLQCMVRGKPHPATVVRLPFVRPNYHRG